MSIVEQLHRKIDRLNEAQQEALLHTVEQWLESKTERDSEEEERERLVKLVLEQRLHERRNNPVKGRAFDEVMTDLEKKYDWK